MLINSTSSVFTFVKLVLFRSSGHKFERFVPLLSLYRVNLSSGNDSSTNYLAERLQLIAHRVSLPSSYRWV